MSNLFDFTDTADLPTELQSKLAGGGRVNPNIAFVTEIIAAGKAAGQPTLSISMITAVWFRMGKGDISQQALRNALNGALKVGTIMKPTRQTYAVIGHVDQVVNAPVPAVVEDATDNTVAPVAVEAEVIVLGDANKAEAPTEPLDPLA